MTGLETKNNRVINGGTLSKNRFLNTRRDWLIDYINEIKCGVDLSTQWYKIQLKDIKKPRIIKKIDYNKAAKEHQIDVTSEILIMNKEAVALKIYTNIDEVEQEFLPKYHLEQVIKKSIANPKYSEELADILLSKKSF